MTDLKLSNKLIAIIIGVAVVVVIIINLIISSTISSSAVEAVEEDIKQKAKEQAQIALSSEIVKEEFIDYIVDNVKRQAVPELKRSMSDAAEDIIKPISKDVISTTKTLSSQVAQLKTRTDDLEYNKMSKLEKIGEEFEKTFSKSAQSIDKFINLRLTDLVPPGTISAQFCNPEKPPAGWLVCDGSTITDNPEIKADHKADEQYSPLINILTELGYGAGDNLVKIPDLRGKFLRGVEKDVKIGQVQEDAIKKHRHPIYGEAQTIGSTLNEYDGRKYRVFMTEIRGRNMPSPRAIFEDTEFQGKTSQDHGRFKLDGIDETRPTNVSIVWCIKY